MTLVPCCSYHTCHTNREEVLCYTGQTYNNHKPVLKTQFLYFAQLMFSVTAEAPLLDDGSTHHSTSSL